MHQTIAIFMTLDHTSSSACYHNTIYKKTIVDFLELSRPNKKIRLGLPPSYVVHAIRVLLQTQNIKGTVSDLKKG